MPGGVGEMNELDGKVVAVLTWLCTAQIARTNRSGQTASRGGVTMNAAFVAPFLWLSW